MGVVLPRRAVHERIERVAIDHEVPLARDEEDLTAAAGKVSAGELIEPGLPVRRGRHRRTSRGSGRRMTGGSRQAQKEQDETNASHAFSLCRFGHLRR